MLLVRPYELSSSFVRPFRQATGQCTVRFCKILSVHFATTFASHGAKPQSKTLCDSVGSMRRCPQSRMLLSFSKVLKLITGANIWHKHLHDTWRCTRSCAFLHRLPLTEAHEDGPGPGAPRWSLRLLVVPLAQSGTHGVQKLILRGMGACILVSIAKCCQDSCLQHARHPAR